MYYLVFLDGPAHQARNQSFHPLPEVRAAVCDTLRRFGPLECD